MVLKKSVIFLFYFKNKMSLKLKYFFKKIQKIPPKKEKQSIKNSPNVCVIFLKKFE
jgi:hypothetical protein